MGKASQMNCGYNRKSQSVAICFPLDKGALFSGWLKLVTQARLQDEVMKTSHWGFIAKGNWEESSFLCWKT